MESYPSLYSPLESIAVAPTLETLAATKKNPTQQFSLQKVGEQAVAPTLETLAAAEKKLTQQFRLQKIGELEAFLRSEIESRSRLLKKYQRAVNVLDGACAALGTSCIVTGAVGAGLLASGVGFIAGLALEGVTGVAGLLDVAGIAVSRRCSTKAAKHEAVRILASSKLNTVHSHISTALEDCSISKEEYKLILDEIEKYRAMKDEIRRKAVTGTAIIDEEAKNELLKRGREEARAAFMKHLGASAQPSV